MSFGGVATDWRPAQPDGLRRVVARDLGAEVAVGEDGIDDARPGVADEGIDVRSQVEAGRLALLGGDVADEHAHRTGRGDGVADLGQEEARQQAGVEAAGARGR